MFPQGLVSIGLIRSRINFPSLLKFNDEGRIFPVFTTYTGIKNIIADMLSIDQHIST